MGTFYLDFSFFFLFDKNVTYVKHWMHCIRVGTWKPAIVIFSPLLFDIVTNHSAPVTLLIHYYSVFCHGLVMVHWMGLLLLSLFLIHFMWNPLTKYLLFLLGWDHLKLFFLVHRNTPFLITRSFDVDHTFNLFFKGLIDR